MSQVITITGQTVAAGSSITLELETLLLPPIKSILIAEQIINPHTHVFAGTSATPAGTVAAPTFTGTSATPAGTIAAHAHDLLFNANAAANAVTMAANSLRNASGGALTVVGNGADGGILNTTAVFTGTAATPAGTNSAPAFTGTAATPAGTNASGTPTRAALTVVTVTPTATNKIQRYGNSTIKLWLTTEMTVNDMLVLTIEERGAVVRP